MKKIIQKQIEKFKSQKLFNKILDIIFVLLIISVIIPATRKEVMTYASKIRMYVTSVKTNEDNEAIKSPGSLQFVDVEGETQHLNDFSDKPVFINYWATWCPPCKAEMPVLKKLYEDYKDDVNFLFISREPLSETQAFMNKHEYDLPVFRITSSPQGVLSYYVLPTSMFISNEKLILSKEGAVNWHSDKIKSIFDEYIKR
ncbi:MAG: TlpA disulfide reductase family protein [Bacteroidales bacterium]